MDENHKTAVFRAAPYIMTQHHAGAIETVMGKARFDNGCGISVSPKSNIIMVMMVFPLLRNTIAIVTRKDKVNLSQGLALSTKMHVLNEPSK